MLRLSLFPKREIVRSALVGLAVQSPGTLLGVIQSTPGKHTVTMVGIVLGHIEINRAVALVRISCIQNLLHSLDLLDDMAGCPRLDGRRSHIQQTHCLIVPESIGLHHLHRLDLLKPCLLCNLVLPLVGIVLQMAHISDIPHETDLVAQMPEELEKHIVSHSRPGVAQMGVAVNGRAADIHSDMSRMHRNEKFFLARKSICQI